MTPSPRGCCAGVRADLRARLPLYVSDWTAAVDSRALSATVFMFFSQAVPAVTFSAYLSSRTAGELGVAETLLGMGACGVLFAVIAGQPLVLVGTTGPVCVFLATLHDVSVALGMPFRGALFWTSLWAAGLHAALAAVGAPRAFVARVTAFSGDTFGALIGLIYLVEGASALAHVVTESPSAGARALTLGLGLGVWLAAAVLTRARSWPCAARLPRALVACLADYGMPTAVVGAAVAQFAATNEVREGLAFLPVPATFAPGSVDAYSIARMPAWAVAGAFLPALVLTLLLYFDHNISALLTQAPRLRLRKPAAYDWDCLVLGISLVITGTLGLPPVYGLIPQAPLHARALAREGPDGKCESVCENRGSALSQSLLLLALLAPAVLKALSGVPTAVLFSILIYLGFEGLRGNAVVARALGLLRAYCASVAGRVRENAPPLLAPAERVLGATQLLCVAAIYGVTLTPAGMLFPALICALIPLRLAVFPPLFARACGDGALELADPRDWGLADATAENESGEAAPAAEQVRAAAFGS